MFRVDCRLDDIIEELKFRFFFNKRTLVMRHNKDWFCRNAGRHAGRQVGRQAGRQAGIQAGRQAGIYTDTLLEPCLVLSCLVVILANTPMESNGQTVSRSIGGMEGQLLKFGVRFLFPSIFLAVSWCSQDGYN